MTKVSLSLPHSLYRADQVKQGERRIAKQRDIELYTLMERAGEAAFVLLREQLPEVKCLLVCCGSGNNGGDGYVFARLARSAGLEVTVWHVGDESKLAPDCQRAREGWLESGGMITRQDATVADQFECVIDALLGTGLKGEMRQEVTDVIAAINHSAAQVISLDVPSGLHADNGHVATTAVKADLTITFIGVKRGLMTGKAADYTGSLHYSGLGIEAEFTASVTPDCLRVMPMDVEPYLLPRKKTAHKGDHGRLLCVGGDHGMGGAIRLASEAALRTGAGLVSVLTRPEHLTPLLAARPELMVQGWQDKAHIAAGQCEWADVLLIGPGLGQSDWSKALTFHLQSEQKNTILDADGLNLLALSPDYNPNRLLTPHPGEAARLLGCSVADVERDRFDAVVHIQQKYGGVVVLKGAGSLIYDGHQCWLVSAGNPGMASGGMGDVLSGILGALVAQGLSLSQAGVCGTWLHSQAADLSSQAGERGMLASDLFPYIRQLVNPDRHDANSI
ncbi:NAD(P)H-hydrate dehydratase [Thaumasiovibrio subtropicus]|uniref:NAD(P)H-hydrate dehydratase n=1 Tax=Thaumasiovibrio subtropicus TaxID=1891207 RepID=UPI000B35D5F6|nr:NAD(P)H-hydrate dehydratase [Thaumasiovibrio subtropicus]